MVRYLLLVCVFSVACAHRAPQSELPEEIQMPASVPLELKGQVGRIEKTRYHSSAVTRTYEGTQLLKEHFENLEFTVQSAYTKVDIEKGLLSQQLTTLQKEGEGDLNAMAYPEQGEHVDVTVNKQGNVFHVAGFSPNSIFYVPSISLPSGPVTVGDTWPLGAEWMSQENGVPLKLQMVTILKRFVKCGPQTCAELEVSGAVNIAVATHHTMDFTSELRGLMYFGLQSGAVVWSQMRSHESLVSEKHRVQIESCLEARLVEPVEEQKEFSVIAPADFDPCHPVTAGLR